VVQAGDRIGSIRRHVCGGRWAPSTT
jgi:hypothetical protein